MTARTRRQALGFAGAALFGSGAALRPGLAQAEPAARVAEYRIKAAFLCKFGNYIEWPGNPSPESPFLIGLLADDAVAEAVQGVAGGQAVQGRPIAIRRIAGDELPDGLAVVFVARSHHARLPGLVEALRGRPVLTVADAQGEADTGAMVSFVVVDDKVKFDIALPRAETSQLRISARLLRVARQVMGKAP